MALVHAAATLRGRAWTYSNGDLFQQVAVDTFGDASAGGELRGVFRLYANLAGDAIVDPDSLLEHFLEAPVSGEGTVGVGEPHFLIAGDMVGEAATAASAEMALSVASVLAGDGEVGMTPLLVVGAASTVQGDSSTTADTEVSHPAGATVDGDAVASATALADDEIAGDIVAGSSVAGEIEGDFLAAAAIVGSTTVQPLAIVRVPIAAPDTPGETVEPEVRYVGFQPGRKPLESREKLDVVTDPGRIRELNRQARRVTTTVRKDTGTSSVVKKR